MMTLIKTSTKTIDLVTFTYNNISTIFDKSSELLRTKRPKLDICAENIDMKKLRTINYTHDT